MPLQPLPALPSDKYLAGLCAGTYDPNYKWDGWFTGDDVCFGIKKLDGYDAIAFRGSTDELDWIRDFEAFAIEHPLLGWVERGFSQGMDGAYDKIIQSISQPAVICGHSLGAARATICAGLFVANGRRPAATVVFGSPKPGFGQLAGLVNKSIYRGYQNGPDYITDVPLTFPDYPYQHPSPQIAIHVEPPSNDEWGIFAWHHIQLYQAGANG